MHIDNTPACKRRGINEVKEDSKPTDAPLFLIGAQIYSYNGITRPRHMLLAVEKKTLSINICFGSTQNHSEISFASHIDSCAAMNVVNILIHQWIITAHP